MVGWVDDLSVSSSPLGTTFGFELGWTGLGLGLGGFGNKGLGPGLDNTLFHFNFEKGVLGRHITICVLDYWFNTILK